MATFTPPPVVFPFKNFCGTSELFAPSREHYRARHHRFVPPVSAARPTAPKTTEALVKPVVKASSDLEDDKRAVEAKPAPVDRHVAVAPVRKVVEPPARIAPAAPPPPPQYHFSPTPQVTGMPQAPPQPPQPPPSQDAVAVPLVQPLNLPSPETMRKHASFLLSQTELMLQAQIEIFIQAFCNGSGYKAPATLILDYMDIEKLHLEVFLPGGLINLPFDQLIWTNLILTFWNALSPYGWDFLHHPDSRVPEFIRRYHYFAVWLGLGSLLREFQFTPPPVPEPEPQPQPQQQPMTVPAPTIVQPSETPQQPSERLHSAHRGPPAPTRVLHLSSRNPPLLLPASPTSTAQTGPSSPIPYSTP